MRRLVMAFACATIFAAAAAEDAGKTVSVSPEVVGPTTIISLNSDAWLLATDPQNVGRQQAWYESPRSDAKKTKVP